MSATRWYRPWWNRWLSKRIPPASSVQLNHRRVFIIPSRTGVAFGGALALMLLAGINSELRLAYCQTFCLLSLF